MTDESQTVQNLQRVLADCMAALAARGEDVFAGDVATVVLGVGFTLPADVAEHVSERLVGYLKEAAEPVALSEVVTFYTHGQTLALEQILVCPRCGHADKAGDLDAVIDQHLAHVNEKHEALTPAKADQIRADIKARR